MGNHVSSSEDERKPIESRGAESDDCTAFEAFVRANQVEALDLGLLTQRCLCAVRAGDVAAVARTLSPELVNLRVTRDPTSGNLVVAATSVPGTQRSSELPLTPSLNPAS